MDQENLIAYLLIIVLLICLCLLVFLNRKNFANFKSKTLRIWETGGDSSELSAIMKSKKSDELTEKQQLQNIAKQVAFLYWVTIIGLVLGVMSWLYAFYGF
jgi:preprotein translocase subunit SecG